MSLATLFLVACAADPAVQSTTGAPATPAGTTAVAGGDELVCTREYPTGSNIPVNKCRTRAQVEAEKAASAEALRRTQAGGPNVKMGVN